MAFDRRQLRLERLNIQAIHDAAFTFWNLRGIIAERWGHGPVFAAMGEGPGQVQLQPNIEDPDRRLVGVYGLKGTVLLGEGPDRSSQAEELTEDWFREVYEVVKPRRTVRLLVQRFGLYPVRDPTQVSRKLRGAFYRNENLQTVLSDRLKPYRDSFHAAVDWLVVDGDHRTSLIAGAVGPPHEGTFFQFPNKQRDDAWWFGFNLNHGLVNVETGIDDPLDKLAELVQTSKTDYGHMTDTVLREVIP